MITEYRDIILLLAAILVLTAGAMTVDHFYGPKDN